MRKRFEQQFEIGRLLIQDTKITTKCRDSLVELMAALKALYLNEKHNEKIFSILEVAILKDKKRTGRNGMNLWIIFVLAQIRLCLNASYDRLHYIANHDKLVRQIMGIEKETSFEPIEFEYQTIYDNVTLLDDETVKGLNELIVAFGHEVYKKKGQEALRLKTDSFVVETNVHFPTDYNLLWDCVRKCLDGVLHFTKKYPQISGWRKFRNWRYQIKGLMREVGKSSASGGKDKGKRLKKSAHQYLVKVNTLLTKLEKEVLSFPVQDKGDIAAVMQIEQYMKLMKKHIDLVYRRLINGEQIPHEEKMFSVFETYTEMVKKGKLHPNVELGKKLAITTDQYHLIVDYYTMSDEQDVEIVDELAKRIFSSYRVLSWSFDKGFSNKINKLLLKNEISLLIMPKRGKRNKQEEEEENTRIFRKFKNKHSAIESNINELEHRGLDRCPDKGYNHFKRYIGLAVSAYNLKKIGKYLLEQERILQENLRKQAA